MRNGDFGQLCTDFGGSFDTAGLCSGGTGLQVNNPNNGTPVPFNNLAAAGFTASTVANNIFNSKYYPLPQSDSVAGGNNFFFNSGDSLINDQGDLKIDYNISEKDHVFGRWSQMHLRNPTFSGCLFCAAGAAQGADQPIKNAVLNWTHAFGPNLLNEARVGFNAVRFDQNLVQTSGLGNISEQLGIAGANFEVPGLLNIQIPGVGTGALSKCKSWRSITVPRTVRLRLRIRFSSSRTLPGH